MRRTVCFRICSFLDRVGNRHDKMDPKSRRGMWIRNRPHCPHCPHCPHAAERKTKETVTASASCVVSFEVLAGGPVVRIRSLRPWQAAADPPRWEIRRYLPSTGKSSSRPSISSSSSASSMDETSATLNSNSSSEILSDSLYARASGSTVYSTTP